LQEGHAPKHSHQLLQGDPAIGDFVVYYNTRRYHESLDNVTPADVYLGRHEEVLSKRNLIKQKTLHERRQHHWHLSVQAV